MLNVTKILQHGFVLLLRDIAIMVVATLVVWVLTIATVGMLGGPLSAGLTRMVLLRAQHDRTPEIADVFYFEHFGRYVFAFWVLEILIIVGFVLFLAPGFYLMTIWFYVFILMVDRDLDVWDAMRQSKRLADKYGLWEHLLLILLMTLLAIVLGLPTRGLAGLLTSPFGICCSVAAYQLLPTLPATTSDGQRN